MQLASARMKTRVNPDNSTCRMFQLEIKPNDISVDLKECSLCFEERAYGYLFEIYDRVIDVTAPDGSVVVEDNRLITTVFVCDECYRKRTVPNE